MMLFIEYPKCSTCKKAKDWLDSNNISYTDRNIVTDNPTYDELKSWINISNIEIKKFFNTSGLLYKELNLKDKLDTMSDDEKINLLSSNGMLVKRPLIISDNLIIIGFKEDKYKALL